MHTICPILSPRPSKLAMDYASIFFKFGCSFGSHFTTLSTIFLITSSRFFATAESSSDSCFFVSESTADWEDEVSDLCWEHRR